MIKVRTEEQVYQAVAAGILEIDAQGRVWRVYHQQTSRWGGETHLVRLKEPRRAENPALNYLQVRVMFDRERFITGAHRLVFFHFNGRIPDGLTINHKDGNTHNNKPRNLELATHSEQSLHAIHVLGYKPWLHMHGKTDFSGERNPQAKLTKEKAAFIKRSKEPGVVLARRFGVAPSIISRVRCGVLWGNV